MLFQRFAADELTLPGRPVDYKDTEVWEPDHKALFDDPMAMAALAADDIPIPTTEAREFYFGPRHLEYWLSGYQNCQKVLAACDGGIRPPTRILDFGGASGRVIRHLVNHQPALECYLSETNLAHVRLSKHLFGEKVHVLKAGFLPPLPLSDNSLDLIMAFSVMTHIADDDISWLLELNRILAPGGTLYLTIHDEETWKMLPGSFMNYMFDTPNFKEYYSNNPELKETVVHYFSDAPNNNCNVFHSQGYIRSAWGKYFDVLSIKPRAHAHQAAVVMRSRK